MELAKTKNFGFRQEENTYQLCIWQKLKYLWYIKNSPNLKKKKVGYTPMTSEETLLKKMQKKIIEDAHNFYSFRKM